MRNGYSKCLDDVGYDVGGRDEVDVVATTSLKTDHRFGELAVVDVFTIAAMVDLPVLTEATQKIAVREEDGSGASLADQRTLLTVMGTEREELESSSRAAKALFPIDAIGSAFTWTTSTLVENLP